MDENYLDSLLNQVSKKEQIQRNDFDQNIDLDADMDIDLSDLDRISLDELDSVDDLDLSALDLDDIDFDDLDVTRLDAEISDHDDPQAGDTEKDYDLRELMDDLEELSEFNSDADTDSEFDSDATVPEYKEDTAENRMERSGSDAGSKWGEEGSQEDAEDVSLQDIDDFIDSINLEMAEDDDSEVFREAKMQMEEDTDYPEEYDENEDSYGEEPEQDVANMDLDDLFSALGIEDENENVGDEAYTADEEGLDEMFESSMKIGMDSGELDEIEDISEVKPQKGKKKRNQEGKEKKTISEILFGKPDEDDEEEERLLEEKKANKEIKKQQKQEEKAGKDAAKKEALSLKKKDTDRRRKEKEAKKAEKKAELMAELEAEKDAKKVPTPVVILVFLFFAAFLTAVVFGSRLFDYSQVIKKATDYFERQRYRLAYDEIAGVEVKDKDEELRDRIYTVMYVERLYESYENNMSLDRPDKALDALLRGLEKYDEHYDEAVELNITDDIDSCKEKIVNALWNTYGLSEQEAYGIMSLEGQEYSRTLLLYCAGLQTGE